jgi:1,2-dihydroxy-3-keto-5-methylthiopentene dioxygenase
MVRAWFMDDDFESDQRLEHHRNPPEFVDLEKLFALTGVEYFKVSRKSNISDSFQVFVQFILEKFQVSHLI